MQNNPVFVIVGEGRSYTVETLEKAQRLDFKSVLVLTGSTTEADIRSDVLNLKI